MLFILYRDQPPTLFVNAVKPLAYLKANNKI